VTSRLGGKSPAIIDESADVELRRGGDVGQMHERGQTCIAPDYALVQERCRRFVDARKAVETFYGSNPDEWIGTQTTLG
jgi:acyl-CoA reductase-like NAD-dependent aldehyde dehydrogenase